MVPSGPSCCSQRGSRRPLHTHTRGPDSDGVFLVESAGAFDMLAVEDSPSGG
jgi:hypothetical protein